LLKEEIFHQLRLRFILFEVSVF